MSGPLKYEYDFDPAAENNTAASIYRLVAAGGPRVLDVGCGPGIVASALVARAGKDVTGLDADEEALASARERGVQRTLAIDLEDPDWASPLVGNVYDVIVFADVLEHVTKPARVLQTVLDLDLLAPEGFVVVSIPNAGHESVIAELTGGRFGYRDTGLLDDGHLRMFTRESFLAVAEVAGFEAVQTHRTTRTLEQTEFRTHVHVLDPELRRRIAEANPEARTYQFIFSLARAGGEAEISRLQLEREELLADIRDLKESLRSLTMGGDGGSSDIKGLRESIQRLEAQNAALTNRQSNDAAVIASLRQRLHQQRSEFAAEYRRMEHLIADGEHELRNSRRAVEDARDHVRALEHQINVIHSSETWKLGRAAKVALTPAVRVLRVARRANPPAPAEETRPGPVRPAPVQHYLTPTYQLSENTELRRLYEDELAHTTFGSTVGRRIAFLIYTADMDEGRGDVYVAVGLGRNLRKLGWDVRYFPMSQWDQVPVDADVAVAMLPNVDLDDLPASTRTIAWVRNETETWSRHPQLEAFDAVLCSSEVSRSIVAANYSGPTGVLSLGVDTDLFTTPTEPRRHGLASTVSQWGRERQLFSALRSRPIEVPLVLHGSHITLGAELQPHAAGLVSYFALPSLYRQVEAVLDDMNHTTKPFGNVNSRLFEALACGAAVITNSSSGLKDLGLESVASYVSNTELHDLLEAANAGAMRGDADRLAAIVRDKHSFAARAREFAEFAEQIDTRRRATRSLVAFYPDYRSTNPYQQMLYASLPDSARATPIADLFDPRVVDRLLGAADELVVHLHWTAPILGAAADERQASERLAETIRILDVLTKAGARLVWTVHNVTPHESSYPALENSLRQELALRAHVIHTMCEETGAAVESHYHLPAAKTKVVPHPSYVGVYPSIVDRRTARERLHIGDEFVYLFLGGIRPYKGVDRLLDVFGRLHNDDPDTLLLLAGRSGKFPGVAELEERAHTTPGVLANFNTVPDDELQLYLRAADVAVFPYQQSLNSGAVLLAYSFGVPVMAPRSGCVASLLDEAAAESFDPSDPASLERAMRSARRLATPEAQRAARAIADRFPPEKISATFVTEVLGFSSTDS